MSLIIGSVHSICLNFLYISGRLNLLGFGGKWYNVQVRIKVHTFFMSFMCMSAIQRGVNEKRGILRNSPDILCVELLHPCTCMTCMTIDGNSLIFISHLLTLLVSLY